MGYYREVAKEGGAEGGVAGRGGAPIQLQLILELTSIVTAIRPANHRGDCNKQLYERTASRAARHGAGEVS